MNLVNGLALHEFSVAQVDRALAQCLGGHSFEFCLGLRLFFSLSHPRDMLIISFSHWLFIAKQCNKQFFLQYGCRSLYILLSKPCFYTDKQNHLLSSN